MVRSSTKRSPGKNRFGFTLIDVALGATILAVGFVGMLEALGLGSQMLDTARQQTIAAQIMQGEMTYWHLQSWSTITSAGSSGLNDHVADIIANYPEFASTKLATLTGDRFKLARSVIDVAGRTDLNGHTALKQITMTVTWTGITGHTHSRSMNAYIGKFGLNVSYRKM